jgi:DNA-binding transcriptional regulator YiaG
MTKDQIKALRTRLNMTQVEFAHKLDIQPVTVSRLELGKCKPSKPTLKALKKLM